MKDNCVHKVSAALITIALVLLGVGFSGGMIGMFILDSNAIVRMALGVMGIALWSAVMALVVEAVSVWWSGE